MKQELQEDKNMIRDMIVKGMFRDAVRVKNGIAFRNLLQASLINLDQAFFEELLAIASPECKGHMKTDYFRADDVRKLIEARANHELIIRQAAINQGGVAYKGADLDAFNSFDEQGLIKGDE